MSVFKYIIAGLGNPTEQYRNNRHNVGFMCVDTIAHIHAFPDWKKKHSALITMGTIGNNPCLLAKPQNYMNNSGYALKQIMHYYKIDVNNLLVVYDELDLSLGQFRYKQGGGLAGHNGLKSIAQHIGTEFKRLRLGIGHPGDKNKVSHYVLSDFSKQEQVTMMSLLDSIANNIQNYYSESPQDFIQKLHLANKVDMA